MTTLRCEACADTHFQADGETPCLCQEVNGWFPIRLAPMNKDVLLFVEESNEQFVGYQRANGNGLFSYAVHRASFIMCRPQWFKPLDKGPVR